MVIMGFMGAHEVHQCTDDYMMLCIRRVIDPYTDDIRGLMILIALYPLATNDTPNTLITFRIQDDTPMILIVLFS